MDVCNLLLRTLCYSHYSVSHYFVEILLSIALHCTEQCVHSHVAQFCHSIAPLLVPQPVFPFKGPVHHGKNTPLCSYSCLTFQKSRLHSWQSARHIGLMVQA